MSDKNITDFIVKYDHVKPYESEIKPHVSETSLVPINGGKTLKKRKALKGKNPRKKTLHKRKLRRKSIRKIA